MLLQSAAMVAKKLLVDEKITAFVKDVCIVLNRKTLSGSIESGETFCVLKNI